MRLTPLDIQSHNFRSAWKGLDPQEVEAFLQNVAEDYESLLRESEARADQIRRLEARVEELSLNEALLKETLVTAQNLGDELRMTAKKEAEVTVSEAEVKAEKILDASHRRAARLQEEIRELRGLRTRLASALRSTIATHSALVDSLCEDEPESPAVGERSAAPVRRSASRPRPSHSHTHSGSEPVVQGELLDEADEARPRPEAATDASAAVSAPEGAVGKA